MSKIAALKKKAADLEKKSPDKALSVYVELLAEMEKEPSELDVALFNRVGDLMVKQGNVADAVDYYEKAVDHYVEGGFFNNAIALCNKILRSSPGRATVYYKLGKISAHKGFKADAKQNFLEYADRMQKAGKMDEAFRALAEFADLCPDQTDIRLMLADQLAKAGKKDQAIEQLQILHAQLDAEGATAEAQAAADRLRALDPTVEPRRAGETAATDSGGGGGDLIFLDLGDTPTAATQRRSVAAKRVAPPALPATPAPAAPPRAEPARPTPIATAPVVPPTPQPTAPSVVEPEPMIEQPPMLSIETTSLADSPSQGAFDSGSLLGLESTSFGDTSPSEVSGGLLDIETTSLGDAPAPAPPADDTAADSEGPTLDFIMPSDDTPVPAAEEPVPTSAPDIPLIDADLDLSLETPAEPAPEPVAEIALVEESLELDVPAAPVTRPSTMLAAKSVEMLQAVVDGDPEDWGSHRELAEAMLESGDRDGGMRELEIAMIGFERAGDLATAMSVADEIVRIDPSSVKHHQKRVEYAYRSNDTPQLVEAYLALADALFRNGQVDKSRSIYQRVLELSPDDMRAQAALSTMPEPAPPPVADRKTPAAAPRQSAATPPAVGRPTPIADDAFVNLGDWLREDEGPKDTRMVVAEEEPTGNEEADFQDMLKKFKQGVAENVEAEDYQSHYDLGVAFKEMGLIDEAIAEFQKALRGPDNRVRTYEAIGQCFIEKGQNPMAATILSRALGEKGLNDEQLIGVLYLLGRAYEAQGKTEQALEFYQRVFVVDITFKDVGDRLNALENAAR